MARAAIQGRSSKLEPYLQMDLVDVVNFFFSPFGLQIELNQQHRAIKNISKMWPSFLAILIVFDLLLRFVVLYVVGNQNYDDSMNKQGEVYDVLVDAMDIAELVYPSAGKMDMFLAVELFIRVQTLFLIVVYLTDDHDWLVQTNERFRAIANIGFTPEIFLYRRVFLVLLGLASLASLGVGMASSFYLIGQLDNFSLAVCLLAYRAIIVCVCVSYLAIFLARFYSIIVVCHLFASQLNIRLVETKILKNDRLAAFLAMCVQMFDEYANFLLLLHLCNAFIVKHYIVMTGGILLLTIPCYRDLAFEHIYLPSAFFICCFLLILYWLLLHFSQSIGQIESEMRRHGSKVYHKLTIQHLRLVSHQTETFKNDLINFFSALDIAHMGFPNTPINLQTIISIFTIFFSATALLVG